MEVGAQVSDSVYISITDEAALELLQMVKAMSNTNFKIQIGALAVQVRIVGSTMYLDKVDADTDTRRNEKLH